MSEPITVIGANTVVSGNLEGDEDLTIEGRVEGTITLSRTLTIENNGVVHANINVRNVVVSGVLVGNVEAEDSVNITEDGRVMGDIVAPRVILVDGASFRGNIDMGEFDVDRSTAEPSTTSRPSTSYGREEEPEVEEARERPAVRPRVRPVAGKRAPASKPKAKPAKPATRTKAKPAKKKAPAPKVRSVGKAKATRKKR
jgi:cytoskeletal protein CcmA (bactofilin family)